MALRFLKSSEMSVKVRLSNDQPFSISHAIPAGFEAYYIPGSDVYTAHTDFGSFLMQLIKLENFSIVYIIFRIEKDVSFSMSWDEDLVYSYVSLKGNFENVLEGRTISIKESRFNIFYTSQLNSTLVFSKPGEYIALILFYPKDFILQYLPFHPSCEDFKSNLIEKKLQSFHPNQCL